jgi:hypothetical protein
LEKFITSQNKSKYAMPFGSAKWILKYKPKKRWDVHYVEFISPFVEFMLIGLV